MEARNRSFSQDIVICRDAIIRTRMQCSVVSFQIEGDLHAQDLFSDNRKGDASEILNISPRNTDVL